jgi:hypothetical protein
MRFFDSDSLYFWGNKLTSAEQNRPFSSGGERQIYTARSDSGPLALIIRCGSAENQMGNMRYDLNFRAGETIEGRRFWWTMRNQQSYTLGSTRPSDGTEAPYLRHTFRHAPLTARGLLARDGKRWLPASVGELSLIRCKKVALRPILVLKIEL